MKKNIAIICIILIIVIASMCMIFANYTSYKENQRKVQNINNEFLKYEKSIVQINTIVTAMNRAIQNNQDNKISKNDDGEYIENDTNSIKIFLEIKSREIVIPMEKLILGEKAGIEKTSYAFSDMLFQITNIEYHEKTGQVKKVIFTAIEDNETEN